MENGHARWALTDGEWHAIDAPGGFLAARAGLRQWATARGYRLETRADGPYGLRVRMTPGVLAPTESERRVHAGELERTGLADAMERARAIAPRISERAVGTLWDIGHRDARRVAVWDGGNSVKALTRAGLLCSEHIPAHITPEGLRVLGLPVL